MPIGPATFDDFESLEVSAQDTSIFLRRFGDGPPLVLLHGFPQTHLMWRHVARLRAAERIDDDHDRADRKNGRRIVCPVLALWSGHGALNAWYEHFGGPIGLWRAWADDVRGKPLDAGHFFPEEIPERTAEELSAFFAATN